MDLFSHLNWYDEKNGTVGEDGNLIKSIPMGKMILVSDTLEAEGSFILHHIIQASSKKSDSAICMLALNQSLYHYNNVGKKLGYNLVTENSKSKFTFINGLSATSYSWIDSLRARQMEEDGIEEEAALDSISRGFQPFPTIRLVNTQASFTLFLKQIYDMFVNDHLKRLAINPKSTTLFIIDQLNLLNSYNNITNNNNNMSNHQINLEILYLIQYLHSYVKDNQNCSILVLFHSDCSDDDTYFKQLQYESDLNIDVKSLQSGYSRDIDGQIEFMQKRVDNTIETINPLHYQVLDNQIRFFTMGNRL